MSSAAPGAFFKRKAAPGHPPVRTVRRFSDIDTDSDFEIEEEDRRSRPSVASLSFKTEATEKVAEDRRGHPAAPRHVEATSEGSILFDSDSEDEDAAVQVAPPPPPTAPAAAAAAPATAAVSTPAASPPPRPPSPAQSLTAAEKLFGKIGPFRGDAAAKEEAVEPPTQRRAESVTVAKTASSDEEPSLPTRPPLGRSAGAGAGTPQASSTPPAAAEPPQTVPTPQQLQEPAPAVATSTVVADKQPPVRPALAVTPPADALTAAFDGTGAASREASNFVDAGGDQGDSASGSDGGFAESVLPSGKGAAPRSGYERMPQPTFITPLRARAAASSVGGPSPIQRDPSDELLLRARLRLDEKRRADTAATASSSHVATPTRTRSAATAGNNGLVFSERRGGGSATPREGSVYSSHTAANDIRSSGFARPPVTPASTFTSQGRTPAPASPLGSSSMPHMLEAKLRRLTQENTRLSDEVNFLSGENAKLRAVADTSGSAEAIKMQLTVDLLRKELQSKELDHQGATRDLNAEKAHLAHQVAELEEQNEGYAVTASQYKQLYEEKAKELEQSKLQLQRLAQDLGSLDHRRSNETSQFQSHMASEKEKQEKLVFLLEDLKKQRQHLHELNQRLQLEIVGHTEDKAQLKDRLAAAEERERHSSLVHDQTVQELQESVHRLKNEAAAASRSHAAQLREEQRLNTSMQARLEEATAAHRAEIEHLRRTLDSVREDHKKSLQEERGRRADAEARLREMEVESRSALSALREKITADSEEQMRRLREDLANERRAREAAQLANERMGDELGRLKETVAYQTQQYQALASDFSHSEEARGRAEQQCGELSSTLREIMQHDDEQTVRVTQLEAALAALEQQHQDVSSAFVSSGTGGGNSMAAQVQLLSVENERLTGECIRLANERNTLIDENGKIAEELLKWKNEMQQFVTSQLQHQ